MAAAQKQMLTANRLRDGVVLYWTAGGWAETLAQGEVFASAAEADAALAAAQGFVADNTVVNPYLFDMREDGSPVKEREIIRAAGPSVRDDLGKQASSPPARRGWKSGTRCIDMTSSTRASSPSAWNSSAARSRAGCRAS